MSLVEEKKIEKINKFFPYKAYPQQIKLMNFLVEALSNTKNNDIEDDISPKIILIESPTGTGKTMMILSCLMEFLDSKNKINNIDENIKDNKDNKVLKNDENENGNEEEDWLKNFGQNQNNENLNDNQIKEENKIKKINEKMDLIMTNIKKKIKKKENNYIDKEEEKMLIKNDNNTFNLFFQKNSPPPIENQIFFCTRTHSQISQIVNEERILYDYYIKHSSKFNHKKFPFSFTFLGSRKQLCINKKINNNSNTLNKINSLCREINDKKETRCNFKKFMYEEMNENKEVFICEEMKSEIKDIEDLLKFGEEFNICPYYATHISINNSQFVVSPYNNILNKRIKNNINIHLENNIVVFDEAHNIIENILQCANTDINNDELIALLISLFLYYNKYRTKLNPSNNLNLRQIVAIIKQFLNFFKTMKSKNNITNNNNEEEYINIKLSDFTIENKLNNYDFYKLIKFIDDSELSNKIQWLLQKEINNIKNDKKSEYCKKLYEILQPQLKQYIENNNDFINNIGKFLNHYLQIIISSNPLNKLSLLLMGILNVDDDGLLLYHKKLNILKFILINPIRDFNYLLKEVKCLIFIGGTMKPFDDYYNLFPTINRKKILTFEGEHIINKGSILPFILSNNIFCNNEIFSFTYESMKKNSEQNIHYLLEFINIYYFLFKEKINNNEKGIGIVLFFQSYDLISKIIEYNNKKQILKIDKNEFFYEKKTGEKDKEEKVKNIFELFSENIKIKNKISILLGVMGGKLSEGINFKDDLCRLLIIVGMPFSNNKSIEIKEKMKYYDKLYNNKKSSINGSEYYENICMKNINQTIGRCIRNYYDFSAIVLMDNRFTYNKYFNKLPKWVIREGKNIIKNKIDFDSHLIKIKEFINSNNKIILKK